MDTTRIDEAGHKLRTDAAASYARMRAAGMPAGGIAAAYRTFAQQLALYRLWKAGKGNQAAYPGPKAYHMQGVALDVTRGTPAQLWLTEGGDPMTRRAGEKIRANAYGWVRTVAGEAWHFQYLPALDQRRAIAYPTLRLGSVGPWVKAVQRFLGVTPTGFYGTVTRARVKAYQARNDLTVDGVAGRVTLAHMGVNP